MTPAEARTSGFINTLGSALRLRENIRHAHSGMRRISLGRSGFGQHRFHRSNFGSQLRWLRRLALRQVLLEPAESRLSRFELAAENVRFIGYCQ